MNARANTPSSFLTPLVSPDAKGTGTRCKITYTGDRFSQKRGYRYKCFTVLVARGEGK